jgi:curved DNA-binding protein CbpA
MFEIENGLFKFDLIDYHAVLGLSVKAEGKEIRKRYLKIAQSLHPDTCKAASDGEKRAASQLLSKLVNPAYENLSRDQSRKEHQIVLAQVGKRIASEASKITVGSEPARELFQAQSNIDVVYQKLVNEIASTQYASLKDVLIKIAQLSELNLVYLMVTQGQSVINNAGQGYAQKQTAPATPANNSTQTTQTPTQTPKNPYIRRAQEYIEKNAYAKAVLELRDSLKSNPNDAEIHALLGFSYIKQDQLAMGRVHTKKALEIEPRNSIALECQAILDKASPEGKSQKDSPKKSGGLFGGLFGGKK